MKLHMTAIPDEPDDLVPWLESQLVGMHLRELVSELAAVHGTNGDAPPLEELLGEHYAVALESGLATLPSETLSRLLQHPVRLLDLHDALTTQGGSHWARIQHLDAGLKDRVSSGRDRMKSWLAETTPAPPITADAVHPLRMESQARARLRGTLGMLMALAATLVFGYFLGHIAPRPGAEPPAAAPAIAWGWASPDGLPNVDQPDAYLNALADAADAWFNKRPESAADIATRIAEFRRGCTQLLLADHKPLSDEHQEWLKSRCRAWAEKLDQALAQLEEGAEPLAVRSTVDDLVKQLVQTLRDRASAA